MIIEALTSFCGVLSMAKGEVREYSNEAVLSDLLSSGYVREVVKDAGQKKSTPKRSVKKNEGQGN